MRTSKEQYDDQIKDVQRNVKQNQSEFDKQKALLEQKVQYLEEVLKEKTDREKESSTEWKSQKAELSLEIKAVSSKYEADIKLLMKQFDEEKEKVSELEVKLHESQEKLGIAEKNF